MANKRHEHQQIQQYFFDDELSYYTPPEVTIVKKASSGAPGVPPVPINLKVMTPPFISAALASTAFYAVYEKFDPIEYMPHRPMFDSRVFNLPMEEVTNYFIWRQKDARRNSVNMLGQYHFPHRELHGKKVDEVQDMLYKKFDVNWLGLPTWMKQGFT